MLILKRHNSNIIVYRGSDKYFGQKNLPYAGYIRYTGYCMTNNVTRDISDQLRSGTFTTGDSVICVYKI